MRIPSLLFPSGLLLAAPRLAAASGFDCAHISVDGIQYDLSPLGGVHSVYHVEKTEDAIVNTTYVLNICNILKGAAIRGDLKCGTSKNICGFRQTKALDGSSEIGYAFPIVGLEHMGHGAKDPEITRLKKLDSSREGLLIKMSGGEYKDESGKKKDAGAVIEFQCDPDRTGLEGLQDIQDAKRKKKRQAAAMAVAMADEGSGNGNGNGNGTNEDLNDDDPNKSLKFVSFGPGDDNSYVLKLDWRTKYACDNYVRDNKDNQSSGHWGFFTWLIIILFLCVAAYLIFGSWLNYNRYGARGWDLLPHGDTIRDLPYIFQDWIRSFINTIQGAGSRGGYSAV
ncbi:autophagy protein Atg27 [Thermoascus aurantiacus ATCC 26904]